MGIHKQERPKGRPLLGGAGPDYPLAMAMGWWGPVRSTMLATSSTIHCMADPRSLIEFASYDVVGMWHARHVIHYMANPRFWSDVRHVMWRA